MAFRKIGSLKLREDRKGRQYLIGGLTYRGNVLRVSIYMNEKKRKEDAADYIIYEQTIDNKCQP